LAHDVSEPGAGVPVFLNAGAGTAATGAAVLQRELGSVARVAVVTPDGIRDAVAGAVRAGHTVVGIAGGDGTLRAAASVLAGTEAALLPVPTGTLNNFARRVGIETVADAAAALQDRTVATLPVGTVDGHIFLNTLTFGEYSRIVRIREDYRQYVGKWPAAAVAFAAACMTLRRFDATLTVNDRTFTRRTPFVWLGMGWGSFPRVHEALERRRHPDLELAIVRSQSRAAAMGFVFRLGLRMLSRMRPVRDDALEIMHTRQLVLDASRRIDATADGEVLRLQPPVAVGVRDDALRVLTGPRLHPPG
jgi:diacylglycerol kinase family enzyme